MTLKDYFEQTKGTGVLSTADGDGRVNAAIYARPHVMEDGRLAFIMKDRLSHANLQSNPRAAFLFIENGPGYKGRRLYLHRTGETTDPELVEALRRRKPSDGGEEQRFVVYFEVEKELPLIGGGDS